MSRSLFTKTTIRELDQELDSRIPNFKLLGYRRDVALINLLRVYEEWDTANRGHGHAGEREAAGNTVRAGLHHAVAWVNQYCPKETGSPRLSLSDSAFGDAAILLRAAIEYGRVFEIMPLLHHGRCEAERDSDGVIHVRFSPRYPFSKELQAAAYLLAAPYDPSVAEGPPIVIPELISLVRSAVPFRLGQFGSLRFEIPEQIFEQFGRRIDVLAGETWRMNPEWQTGGYSLGEFRRFWRALLVLCAVHDVFILYLNGDKVRRARTGSVLWKTRDQWERAMARYARLDAGTVSAIFEDLVRDESMFPPGRRGADVTLQPFLPIGGGQIAVSRNLVLCSYAERNLWHLLSIKRPAIHGALANLKEHEWSGALRARLATRGYELFDDFSVKGEGSKSIYTNLDALILDRVQRFGLVCELKWLMEPGTAQASLRVDDEILKGIDQATQCSTWIATIPESVRQRTGLSEDELRTFEFRPIVMCKNTLPTGFVVTPGVPVISERLFDWVLFDPHRRELRDLWRVANELRYLPKEGYHFVDEPLTIEFDGIRFVLEEMTGIDKAPWDPRAAIDFG
jgi:hypothetical protein